MTLIGKLVWIDNHRYTIISQSNLILELIEATPAPACWLGANPPLLRKASLAEVSFIEPSMRKDLALNISLNGVTKIRLNNITYRLRMDKLELDVSIFGTKGFHPDDWLISNELNKLTSRLITGSTTCNYAITQVLVEVTQGAIPIILRDNTVLTFDNPYTGIDCI